MLRPLPVLLLTAILTVAAIFPLRQLAFDNTPESWLPAESPGLLAVSKFRAQFGDDSFLLAFAKGKELSKSPEHWLALARKLRKLDGVERVLLPPFAEEEDGGPQAPLSFYLQSEDEQYAALAILTKANLALAQKAAFVESIEATLAQKHPSLPNFELAGTAVLTYDLDAGSRQSLSTLGPIVALVLCLVLWITTREWRGVLAGLLVIVISSVWTLGLLGLFQRPLNLVVATLPAILAVVTIMQAIHLLTCFQCLPGDTNCPDAWRRSVRSMAQPGLLCALTTAAGFLSLATSSIPPIRDLGLFAAAGVMFSFVLCYSFFPALLSLSTRVRPRGDSTKSRWTRDRANRYTDGLARRRTPILLVGLALLGFALFGISKLHPESHVLDFFASSHRIPRNYRSIEQHLMGLTPIDVVFSGPKSVLLSDSSLATYRKVFSDTLKAEPLARQVVSLVLEPARGTDLEFVLSPAELRAAIEEEDLPADFRRFVQIEGDRITLRTTLLTTTDSSNAVFALIERLRTRIQQAGIPNGIAADITGSTSLLIEGQVLLPETQIQSFSTAFLIITVVILVAFRSLRGAVLALIPNLVPVAFTMGYMGWANIPLNTATVTVAGIALGLIVDDTIHFMHHYLHAPSYQPAREAVANTLFHVARPATIASLAIALGFALFAFSSFLPTAHFGLLMSITAVSALACDLVLLPALLLRPQSLKQ
ncbi:MAG: MMPL family transporter [Bryobacter sp.]